MTDPWHIEVDKAIDDRAARLIELRRYLHAHPEVSGEEHDTSLHLYQLLVDEGFDVRMGPDGRGLILDPREDSPAAKIALRADIDALMIHDEKEVAYRSRNDGVMHACGHDAHSAIVFGALTALHQLQLEGKLPWPVNFRGVFQPSEETATGAAEMVRAGATDGVQAILATHVDPARTVGTVGVRTGVLTAHCDAMRLVITGRGGHAARPHETIDPIATAAQLINSIYLAVPRATDSLDSVVVTIGHISGGMNPNVIPEQVEMRGTLRTLDLHVRDRTVQHIEQICRGVAESSGTRIDMSFESGIGSVCNEPEITDLIRWSAHELLGEQQVEEIGRASMGSEDFAVYLERIPGAMFRLGCAPAGKVGEPLHTTKFDVDEAAIAIGAKILARTAIAWSEPGRHDAHPHSLIEKSV